MEGLSQPNKGTLPAEVLTAALNIEVPRTMNGDFDVIDYLKQARPADADLLEAMRYALRHPLHYVGDQFRHPRGARRPVTALLRACAESVYVRLFANGPATNKKRILSSAYFNYDSELKEMGYDVLRPPWSAKRGSRVLSTARPLSLTGDIRRQLSTASFNVLVGDDFLCLAREFRDELKRTVLDQSFDALMVPNDVDFFSAVAISTFRQLGKPTFLFAHGGMPNVFDRVMDNQTDYITMWGQKQVDAYVRAGFDRGKFRVTGHPFYRDAPDTLRFDLDDVLVLTKSLSGACPLRRNHLEDPGNAILYLLFVQEVLSGLGVTRVRLRPHPSDNPNWYREFIDQNFFSLDNQALTPSLNRTSLVIGPISTTFIDAMAHGVNYTVFEPAKSERTMMGYPIVPPLDGKDARIPIAHSLEDLRDILEYGRGTDVSVFPEFAPTTFDLSFMKEIVSLQRG